MKRGLGALVVVAALGGLGYLGAQAYADGIAGRQVKRILTHLPADTKVSFKAAEYGLLSGRLTVSGVELDTRTTGAARIEQVTLASFDVGHRVPHRVKAEVRGFEMTIERAEPETRKWMQRLGYDRIVVDIDYAYRYLPDRRELHIERIRITGPAVGTIDASASLGNVTSIDAHSFGDVAAIAMQAVVRGFRIDYIDGSLVDRLIKARAEEAGQSEAQFRQTLLNDIDEELKRSNSAETRRQLQHLRAFIKKPERIEIDAQPPRPMPVLLVASVRNADVLSRLLGLTIRSRPKAAGTNG